MGLIDTGGDMRVYGHWAGNPSGTKENPANCIAVVADGGRSCLTHQCQRRRGYGKDGLFCKQHAKKY
jgi:hypothetical protein